MEILLASAAILGLIIVANIAEERPRWTSVVLLALAALVALTGFSGGSLVLMSLLDGSLPSDEVPPVSVGATLAATGVAGLLLLSPVLRRRLATVLPFRPQSPVHLTALILSLYLVSWTVVNLLWFGGIQGLQASAENVPVSLYVAQTVVLVVFALAGVGLFLRRSWTQVIDRLGLGRFRWGFLMISTVAAGVLMVINFTVAALWLLLAPEQAEAISQISEVMLGNFDSLGMILMLSAFSSVSEEMLFRGALQPRLGIVLTSLLFACTHLQYAVSPATAIVLLIGVILGLLRRHFGTWTAILTHFLYNFGLLLLGLIAGEFLEMLG